jgi:hypothetical protein
MADFFRFCAEHPRMVLVLLLGSWLLALVLGLAWLGLLHLLARLF